MKWDITKNKYYFMLSRILLFVCAFIILLYIHPSNSASNSAFSENIPWPHETLIAKFNYNIEKSTEQIEHERDSVLASAPVFFYIDTNTINNILKTLKEIAAREQLTQLQITSLSNKLKSIYKTGVISRQDVEKLHEEQRDSISLKSGNFARVRAIDSFATPIEVFAELIHDNPSWINDEVISTLDLNEIIVPNILLDENLTEKSKDNALLNISRYEGEVLAGQKIIDRGEIVTPQKARMIDSHQKNAYKNIDKFSFVVHYLGTGIILFVLLGSFFLYLKVHRPHIFQHNKNIIFLLATIILFAIISAFIINLNYYSMVFVVPFVIPAILIRIFMDSRTAVRANMTLILICMTMLPPYYMALFVILQALAVYIAMVSLRRLEERSQLVQTSFIVFLTYIITYTGWIMAERGYIDWSLIMEKKAVYIYFAINLVLLSFVYSLLFLVERTFGFISEVTMLELGNTSKNLLRELSEQAPGTFQHVIQVSSLAVSAALKIGANPILTRTGAMYHDIGKMKNTIFFTENQPTGVNPHKYLSCKESSKIIVGHVEEGVKLAKKHNLPEQIIDFIRTHHGKGLTGYFYTQYCNENPDEEVDIADFSYPGPNPTTKETAIVMMADVVEAASRSLKENTKEAISNLVNNLIDKKVEEGLFVDAPITFKDIKDIKEVFIEKLISMRHVRIEYPKVAKKENETEKTIALNQENEQQENQKESKIMTDAPVSISILSGGSGLDIPILSSASPLKNDDDKDIDNKDDKNEIDLN